MSLTITYTNESSEVKSQNSQGNISLILGYNGRPYDLHVINDNNLRIRIGNQEGYINDINIDTNTLDDDEKYRGAFTIPLSNSVIQQLPPGVYYLEVWINVSDQNNQTQQMIFPSDDTLPFTLTPNIVNDSNSMPMITFDRVRQAWEDFKNFIMGHQAQIEDDLATFDGVTDSFVDKVDDGISGYQGFVNRAGSQLDSLANSGKANIGSAVTDANSNVADINLQVNSAKTQISTAANGVYSVVDSDVNSAEQAISATTASGNSQTASTVNSAENIINNAANGVVNTVNQTVNSAVTRVDNAADGIRGQVEGIVSSGDSRINNTAAGIESITSSAVSNASYISSSLDSRANSAVSNVNYTINSADNNMSNFASDINDRTSSADHHIDLDVSDAESNVDSTVASADSNMSNFASDINDRTSSADNHIDSDVTSADSHIDHDVASGDDHIDNTVSNADSHVSSNVISGETRISNDVTTGESNINSVASAANTNTTNIAQNNISMVNHTTSSADSHISSNVISGEARVSNDVTSGENSITNTVNSADDSISSYASSGTDFIVNTTNSAVDRVNQDTSTINNDATSVTDMAQTYSNNMNSQANSAYTSINASGVNVYNGINTSGRSVDDDINYSAQSAYSGVSTLASSAYINIDGYNGSASTAISGDTSSGISAVNSAYDVASSAIQYAVNHSDKLIESDITNGVKSSVSSAFNDQAVSVQAQVTQTSNDVSTINYDITSLSNSTSSMAINVMNQTNANIDSKAESALSKANKQTNNQAYDIQDQINNLSNNAPVLVNSAYAYADSVGGSAINQANMNMEANRSSLSSRDDDLQNQINSHPNWADENWTRNQVAPSLANSAKVDANAHADQVANSAINQANTNMSVNRDNLNNRDDDLQNQINNSNLLPNKGEVPDTDLNNVQTDGIYSINAETLTNAPGFIRNNSNFYGTLKVFHEQGTPWQIIYSTWGNNKDRNNTGTDGDGAIAYRSFSGNGNVWNVLVSEDQIDDLQNQINSHPNWDDENWTRNQANQAAINALNQANSNMETNRSNLQNQITGNYNNELAYKGDLTMWNLDEMTTTGIYLLHGQSVWNTPYGGTVPRYGALIVMPNGDPNVGQKLQILQDNNGPSGTTISWRIMGGAVDNSWHVNATMSDITNLQNQLSNSNLDQVINNAQQPSTLDVDYITTSGVYADHANFQNSPSGFNWGDLYVHNPNDYGYAYQILLIVNGEFWYRASNIGANGGNFKGVKWQLINASGKDINDLQNQINNRADWNTTNNLQNQINSHPNWDDENWTRNQANNAATNALNQANSNMETNRVNLQNQIDNNYNNSLVNKGHLNPWNWNEATVPGIYAIDGQGAWNTPYNDGQAKYGTLIVIQSGSPSWNQYLQIFQDNDTPLGNDPTISWRILGNSVNNTWHTTGTHIADNEDDARNKSNQFPGAVFIYSD